MAREFSKTEQIQHQQEKVKPWKGRIFENQEEYEARGLRGDHDGQKDRPNVTSMDQVNKSDISMVKISAPKVPMTQSSRI